MKTILVLASLIALLALESACIVTTAAGTFDCLVEPSGGTLTTVCHPVAINPGKGR